MILGYFVKPVIVFISHIVNQNINVLIHLSIGTAIISIGTAIEFKEMNMSIMVTALSQFINNT